VSIMGIEVLSVNGFEVEELFHGIPFPFQKDQSDASFLNTFH